MLPNICYIWYPKYKFISSGVMFVMQKTAASIPSIPAQAHHQSQPSAINGRPIMGQIGLLSNWSIWGVLSDPEAKI